MSGAVRVIASAILYTVIARLMPYTVIARLMLYSVIARRAMPDVAISSQPTIDYVDSVLSLRRFFTTFRMTFIISLLIANYSLLIG